jgi:hypothetical protein
MVVACCSSRSGGKTYELNKRGTYYCDEHFLKEKQIGGCTFMDGGGGMWLV